MIQNLDIFESDAVIIDFEDSVIHYDKDAARSLIANFINKYPQDKLDVFIRINDVDSPFFNEDIEYTKNLNITGYVVPKATKEALETINKLVNKALIPIIESPLSVLHAEAIASVKNVRGLLLGAEDLTKEMNIPRTKVGFEILRARGHLALVCHAYKIEAIDTPWTHKDDLAGLQEDTKFSKQLGFTARSAIHPNHISVINDVYTPSKEDIINAKRIVKKAQESNKGAFSLDGKMIDLPIIEKAQKLLEKAKRYNVL